MILSIMDKLTELSDNFKEWLIANGDNPIIWIAFFGGGLLLFFFLYNYLKKGKSSV